MKCEGCNCTLSGGLDTYGDVGQSFCFSCWAEELSLRDERAMWEADKARLLAEKARAEQVAKDIERQPEEFTEREKLHNWATLAAIDMVLGDTQNELDCLTAAYQRQYSVIGQAA